MAVMVVMEGIFLMEETVQTVVILSLLRAARVVRAEPIQTVRENFIFPVQYKLDISIVNDLQRDPHALALIKSLIYYCQLSGSRCIAEGVDSLEKFNMLKALGIDRFQGYLISPPVTGDNLEDLIQRFSPGRYPTSIAG